MNEKSKVYFDILGNTIVIDINMVQEKYLTDNTFLKTHQSIRLSKILTQNFV